jgi:hypothetical protein
LFGFFRYGIWEETKHLGTQRPRSEEQKGHSQKSQHIIAPRTSYSEGFSPWPWQSFVGS